MAKRVCVIGAGPSGMCFLYHLDAMRRNGLDVPEVVCYEKQADWGGLWNFDWRTGTDQFGEPVHGSMYHNLWTNSPKEGLEFPDYTFEDHFGKPIPSYPPRSVITDYLKGRCNKTGTAKQPIEFRKVVKNVEYNVDSDDFKVVVKDLVNNVVLPTQRFDFVVVCSGHFSVPNVPHFDGLDTFTGRIMHAHDFRDAREFTGKKILIIGARKSAEDIAMQCVKYGSGDVICTYRNKPMGYKWPNQISEKPVPSHFVGNTAHFRDGTKLEVDAIIMCTGYLNHFPFMEDSLRMTGDTTLYPPHLYKGTVWMAGGNNKVIYIGMQEPVYSYTMFDVQALWALHYITKKLTLPERQTMEDNIALWTKRKNTTVHDLHDAIDYQTDFVLDLSREVFFPYDIDVAQIYHTWEDHKQEDVLTYRDRSFASKFTGTQAPVYHTTFMKAFDDSLESFINFDTII